MKWLLCFMLLSCVNGCEREPGDLPDVTPQEEEEERSVPVAREIRIGTHPLGEHSPNAFIAVKESEAFPIVYGPQGAYMVIVAVQLVDWAGETATIRVNAAREGEVIASLFYPDFPLVDGSGPLYASNLFMLTEGWESYADLPLQVSVEVSGAGEFGEHTGEFSFQSPPPLYR